MIMNTQLTNLRCFGRNVVRNERRRGLSVRVRAEGQVSVTTPHSGYHYDYSGRRFFEGWYFKVTLPGQGSAFALIYSIEDPDGGPNSGVGAQIMGPQDSYLCHYSKDPTIFWAEESALELGACFSAKTSPPKSMLSQRAFNGAVEYGYQASQTWHQGRLAARETGASGLLPSTVKSASWAFSVQPVHGWGSVNDKQRATAGWLASLPVFEPHWQVLMALGKASGWIEWDGKRYEFQDAPAYAEKNWGGGFPKKWFWIQCDRFYSPCGGQGIALTSVGATRGLLNLPVDEEVGLVGLHWGDQFHEFVPWTGDVEWEVLPWGNWKVSAKNATHRVLVEATCDKDGTPLRAPTANNGLSPLCKDSFFGRVRVRLWTITEADEFGGATWEVPSGELLLLDATSEAAAVEIGGGPWWKTWTSQAQMMEPLKSIVGIPVDVEGLSSLLPDFLRPKGL